MANSPKLRRGFASRRSGFAVCWLGFVLTMPIFAQQISPSETTAQVLDHHLAAFGSLDMDAILEDYTDNSTILTPNGAVKGLAEIRSAFAELFAEFGKPGATFEMKQKIIEGNVAYILWTAQTADNIYELGTDTFVIRESKIAVQSFTPKTVPKEKSAYWIPGI